MHKTILCVPDAHVEPNQSLTRFEKLGKLIVDRQPDTIIDLGDFGSFTSLSHWDQNKRLTIEGRRYEQDVDWIVNAYDLMFAPLDNYNVIKRKNKMRQYTPGRVKIMGNHEEWPYKYLESNPALSGFMDPIANLGLIDKYLFNVVPYRVRYEEDGITYCHVPMAQNAQPISGKYVTAKAWERHSKPVVFAHTHRFNVYGDKRIDGGGTTEALSCGCFFEEIPAYSKGSESGIWQGLVLLHVYGEGKFDFERISMERLFNEY